MATMTKKKFTRTTPKGNTFTVFCENEMASNGTFRGAGKCTRTWAECNGQQFECETGRPFTAWAAVQAAGF